MGNPNIWVGLSPRKNIGTPKSETPDSGVAFWYDLKNYRITNVDGARLMGIAEDQAALLRLNLKKGRNNIVVHLAPKKRG
ncbi:MAG: hypothetical protein M9933_18215 [Chitinophagaceae bacterium]|nr:hypothetical protein [Chitinophagaceae bacterium]